MHRDIKLANILIHFPQQHQLLGLTKQEKMIFLENVDLITTDFIVKIADFGLAKKFSKPELAKR